MSDSKKREEDDEVTNLNFEATIVRPRSVFDDAFDAHTVVRVEPQLKRTDSPAKIEVEPPVPATPPPPPIPRAKAKEEEKTDFKDEPTRVNYNVNTSSEQPKIAPIAKSTVKEARAPEPTKVQPRVKPATQPATPPPPPEPPPVQAMPAESRTLELETSESDAAIMYEVEKKRIPPKMIAVAVGALLVVLYLVFGTSSETTTEVAEQTQMASETAPPKEIQKDIPAAPVTASPPAPPPQAAPALGSSQAAIPALSVLSQFDELFTRTQTRARPDSSAD